ncbi:MAG: porin family protein [Bacteroidetes bacterium]|nr:porin family protein [Bacteroidota bacterium]
MKTSSKYAILLAVLIFTAPVFGQLNKLSVGVVGTHFANLNGDDRISGIDNPFGYGLVLGYKVNNNLSVAFTGEYFKDDIEGVGGQEKNIRTHISAYITPFELETIIPYISAGVVYTNRKLEYDNSFEETKSIFNGRFGLGVDYPVFSGISLNADLGLYTDGLSFVGWSNSLGFRYSF